MLIGADSVKEVLSLEDGAALVQSQALSVAPDNGAFTEMWNRDG